MKRLTLKGSESRVYGVALADLRFTFKGDDERGLYRPRWPRGEESVHHGRPIPKRLRNWQIYALSSGDAHKETVPVDDGCIENTENTVADLAVGWAG